MAEESGQNILNNLSQWPASRKIAAIAVLIITALLFGVVILQSRTTDHTLLYANLAMEDSSEVVSWLKDRKIPYSLKDEGRSIYVPSDKVYDVRVELAGEGLPQGGGIGFEIFDKQSFGVTDFAQKINYQRAQQGELSRTISALKPVDAARVHLVLPERRAFKSQQESASASVYVKLKGPKSLSEDQVAGIIHLVASSVEGLESDNVTVIDNNGKVLSRPNRNHLGQSGASGMLGYQRELELSLEERAQSILDKALGFGNTAVRVTAVLDFSKSEQTDEIYDPDKTAIRSENVINDKSSSSDPGGVSGSRANMGGNSGTGNGASSARTEELTNYEISKTVKHTVNPTGKIQNLSVSVIVSENFVQKEGQNKDSNSVAIADIENIVRTAIGLDENRGDRIAVTAVPFNDALFVEPESQAIAIPPVAQYMPLIKYGLLAIGIIILYLIMIRPLFKTLSGSGLSETPMQTASEIEERMRRKSISKGGSGGIINPLPSEADDVTKSAQIVKGWLKEG